MCYVHASSHQEDTRTVAAPFSNDGIFARRLPINFIVIGVIALIVG